MRGRRSRLAAWLLAAMAMSAAPVFGDTAMSWVGRHAHAMPAAKPEEISDAQLQAFGAAIGSARVVALAEQTHGGREEFELRLRLLRYLHEHKGFDVLLLESGVFDIALLQEAMQRGEKLEALAPGRVFYMYSKSDAGRGLLRYLDERQARPRPLLLSGIDSQLSGELSQRELLPRLKARLRSAEPDWPLFKRLAQRLFALDGHPPPPAEQLRFDALTERLRVRLCAGKLSGEDGLLCRSLASLQAQAATLWRGDYQRDHAMADNVLWQLQQLYPGKKAVIWGHIIHLGRGVKIDARHRFAGDILGDKLGRDYYVLNTTALQGSFLEFASGQVHPVPPAYPRSLEAALARSAAEFIFLDAPRPMRADLAGLPSRSMEFGYGLPTGGGAGLGRHWDGVFYIRELRPVTMER
ncbi:erythromycin esterase family protein [Paucibacter sp. PLA-PC-4]|uniref:erythromycin esterase family protein n=1 Tax=Paucibacter sp. PLA-PC-4 TaxID=2993655 RepID=UPI00224AC890|nr:erythromycin esterase family protein [Paucibacter sp. PLA-PC-4]MCX2865343.1 erythromycin esterase family protein [Paucibacter sp. PLA-PC-4]